MPTRRISLNSSAGTVRRVPRYSRSTVAMMRRARPSRWRAAGFRNGTDLSSERHDGQAVTCDDFIAAPEDANEADCTQFKGCYSQAGTPVVQVDGRDDTASLTFQLRCRQSCPPTPGRTE